MATAGSASADASADAVTPGGRLVSRILDDYENERIILATYDELFVVGWFDGTRIVGDIDRLFVSDGPFHIIDYKTNETSDSSREALAERYWSQRRVYVAALHQSDPSREIQMTFFFTAAGVPKNCWFDRSDFDRFEWMVSQHEPQ